VVEGRFVLTIEHCRVTGHILDNGQMVEVIELYNVTIVRKEPPGGSERKSDAS
jgi:hypothetical protein